MFDDASDDETSDFLGAVAQPPSSVASAAEPVASAENDAADVFADAGEDEELSAQPTEEMVNGFLPFFPCGAFFLG